MIYTGVILLLLSLVLFARNFKNRIAWYLNLSVWGFIISLFAMIILVSKTGNYRLPSRLLFRTDYQLYLNLTNTNISPDNVIRIFNLGVVTYLAGFILIMNYFSESLVIRGKLAKILRKVLAFSLLFAYYIFYDPKTSYSFYIHLATLAELKSKYYTYLLTLLNIADTLLYFGIFVILTSTVMSIMSNYAYIPVRFIKKQLFSLAIVINSFNLLYITIFITGKVRQPYIFRNSIYHFIAGKASEFSNSSYFIYPFIMLAASCSILFLLIKYKGLDTTHYFKTFIIGHNLKTVKINYRSVFHSFKNIQFVVMGMSKKALEQYGTEEGKKALESVYDFSSFTLNNISRLLDSMKDVNIKVTQCNINDCIDKALANALTDKKISIQKNYISQSHIYADEYHLTEALLNIITNAVEAILQESRKDGRIKIEILSYLEWIIIKITDNGCGMDKKVLKRIFKPFYSTKHKQQNWGIGLHYASTVIRAHSGFIEVESAPGSGTTFEILLPNIKRRLDHE